MAVAVEHALMHEICKKVCAIKGSFCMILLIAD